MDSRAVVLLWHAPNHKAAILWLLESTKYPISADMPAFEEFRIAAVRLAPPFCVPTKPPEPQRQGLAGVLENRGDVSQFMTIGIHKPVTRSNIT